MEASAREIAAAAGKNLEKGNLEPRFMSVFLSYAAEDPGKKCARADFRRNGEAGAVK